MQEMCSDQLNCAGSVSTKGTTVPSLLDSTVDERNPQHQHARATGSLLQLHSASSNMCSARFVLDY